MQRLKARAAALYDGFSDELQYAQAKAHAASLGAVLWSDDKQRAFVAAADAHGAMRTFFRDEKARKAAAAAAPAIVIS